MDVCACTFQHKSRNLGAILTNIDIHVAFFMKKKIYI